MSGKKKQGKESLATFRRITRYDQMIASGSYPSVKKLMDEFEISEATVHRDLDALRYDFGAEKYLKYDRERGGYCYTDSMYRLPALLTTEEQIISVKLIANLLELIKGTPVYEPAKEVFEKLSANIDHTAQNAQAARLNAEKLSDRILFLGMEPADVKDKKWETLEQAMANNNCISFDYEDYIGTARITMKPYQLVFSNGTWSLYGYRTNKGFEGNIFFPVPEMKKPKIEEETFELPEDFEYKKHAVGNFGDSLGETETFKLQIFHPMLTKYVKAYKWAPDQEIKVRDDGIATLTFSSNQYFSVLEWVLGKGQYMVPLQPERLVKDWKENAIAMGGMAKNM